MLLEELLQVALANVLYYIMNNIFIKTILSMTV